MKLSSNSIIITRNLIYPEIIVRIPTLVDWYWSVRLAALAPDGAIFSVLEYDNQEKSYKPEIEYLLQVGKNIDSSKSFLYLTPSSYTSTDYPIHHGIALRIREIISSTHYRNISEISPGKRLCLEGDVIIELIPGNKDFPIEIRRGECYKRLYAATDIFSSNLLERKQSTV